MNFAQDQYAHEQQRGFRASPRSVCLEHILDSALRDEMADCLTEESCNYCDAAGTEASPVAVTMDELLEALMSAVRTEYGLANDEGVLRDEGDWFGAPILSSDEVLDNVCSGAIDYEVLDDAREELIPEDWTIRDFALLRPAMAMREGWDSFSNFVKCRARFTFLSITPETSISPDEYTPREMLDAIDRVIDELNLFASLRPGDQLWRGRMRATSEPPGYDAAKIGPPPEGQAGANRMSPAGISMFYGSVTVETAVAEIATRDSRRFAVVAAFEPTQELQIIDLTAIPDMPSIFSKELRHQRAPIQFLEAFSRKVSEPVSGDGQEHIEYVPTQVLTEYLRWLSPLSPHGIKFRSSQDDGANYVIFAGPDECADSGHETDRTWLRLVPDSEVVFRVVAHPMPPTTGQP